METFGQKVAGLLLGAAIVPVFMVLMIPFALLNGWIVATLWEWLIEPTFTSAPDLNTVQGWGIALVITYLTYPVGVTKEKDAWAAWVLTPFVALFGGWIIHNFFM
jgi:hypothetical protein